MLVKQNEVEHIRMASYHPASNGAVERLVQSFKQATKTTAGNSLTLQQYYHQGNTQQAVPWLGNPHKI